jgi:hypothetical protein
MNIFRTFFAASILAVVTAAGAGCTEGTDIVDTTDDKVLSELEIETGIDTLSKGDSIQFKAMATYADGTREDVTGNGDTVWNTSAPDVATVDGDGMVTAVDEGMVDITATLEGKSAEETFLVTP